MRIADADILVVPGLGNAGPDHWQSRWAERFSTGRMVEQDEWKNPDLRDWTAALVEAVEMAERPVVLVAHSLGVSALVHAAPRFPEGKVVGAFLVSPPDHEGKAVPRAALSFGDVPRNPLPFPSMLVASTNDDLVSAERAADMAASWGSDMHLAVNAGHINPASGHGPWPEGLMMFTRLMQRL
ncbi:RBBP9/YdeN family alpha/beta hydrolase [Devosia sp.]|uniref:RBBP9/YdeN family alpha/beta hydrolase n=1 Tax=Devosia sp. TaxID=1871048 RepID=UPI003A922A5C